MKMNIELPPGVTLYLQQYPPVEIKLGDLWCPVGTKDLYRLTIKHHCDCDSHLVYTWELIDGGIKALEARGVG